MFCSFGRGPRTLRTNVRNVRVGGTGEPVRSGCRMAREVNVNEQASRAEWSVGCHDRIEQLPETSAAARRQWKGATGSSRSMALDTFRRQQEGGPPGKALARKAIPGSLCRAYTEEESIRHLAAIMRQREDSGAARVQAANILLDRGWNRRGICRGQPSHNAAFAGDSPATCLGSIHAGKVGAGRFHPRRIALVQKRTAAALYAFGDLSQPIRTASAEAQRRRAASL